MICSDFKRERPLNEALKRLDAAAMQKQIDAMAKGLTGASIQDMEDMSDEELDQLEKETLEKYKK